MPTIYGLSESDVKILGEIISSWKTKIRNTSGRSNNRIDLQEQQAPEVYLARTGPSGIPQLNSGDNSTGTGTGTATIPLEDETTDDVPGAASCSIYRLINDGASMLRVFTLTAVVYNVCPFDIPGDAWVTVHRDKFGNWFVPSSGIGSDVTVSDPYLVDHVHVVTAETGTGTGTTPVVWYCERVTLSAGWPPVADPGIVYENVYESENREPRMIDAAGGAVSHIIPLFRDLSGNHYIVYPAVDTQIEFDDTTSFVISEDDDCNIIATPMVTTKRITLSVAPAGVTETGLELNIESV